MYTYLFILIIISILSKHFELMKNLINLINSNLNSNINYKVKKFYQRTSIC